jgi:hypothetical protein
MKDDQTRRRLPGCGQGAVWFATADLVRWRIRTLYTNPSFSRGRVKFASKIASSAARSENITGGLVGRFPAKVTDAVPATYVA